MVALACKHGIFCLPQDSINHSNEWKVLPSQEPLTGVANTLLSSTICPEAWSSPWRPPRAGLHRNVSVLSPGQLGPCSAEGGTAGWAIKGQELGAARPLRKALWWRAGPRL